MICESPSRELCDVEILLVEDDVYVAEALTVLLQDAGAVVTAVGSAGAAFRFVDSGKSADLYIIDLGLPGVCGESLYQWMRGRGVAAPVIFSTGFDARERLEGVPVDSATTVLQKPYGLLEICRAARALAVLPRPEENPATSAVAGSREDHTRSER